MQLLPGEEGLVTSNQDRIILTNQRIHQTAKQWGRSYQITIFLENISSTENVYKSNPIYLVVAGIGLFLALATMDQHSDSGLTFGGFAAAVVFLLLWLNSRRHVVTISSNGGAKLNFLVEGMADEQVQDFIHKVEASKAARMSQLFRH